MIETASCETETPFDRLLAILCGKEKAGKSRLAATSRKPVLFMDFDRRRQALAGIKDVYALTFADEGAPRMPTGYNDVLTILSKIEGGATIKDLIPGTTEVRRPKTIVIDSITAFGKLAMNHALYSNPALRREITVAGMKLFFVKNWDSWNAEVSEVVSVVERILAFKDSSGQLIDVILIFHEAPEETPDSTSENRKYTGKIELYPGRYQYFNKYFSEIWRVTRDSPVPKIQVIPNYSFAASSNLDFTKISDAQINDPVKGPDISRMIELVTGVKASSVPQPITK